MGKLLDLLKFATGQKSLHDPIGKWRQEVSRAIDGDQVGTGTGFVMATRAADQAPALVASTPTIVIFSSVRLAENAITGAPPGPIADNEISYDTSTGIFTLTPGLYELHALVRFGTFATDATDFATFHWAASGALAVPLFANMEGNVYGGASTLDRTAEPVSRVLFRVAPGANVTVAVAASAEVGATTVIQAGSNAIVHKLS